MLNLTGRLADGWVPSSSYVPPTKLPEMQARIDEGAAARGGPAMYNAMRVVAVSKTSNRRVGE